MSGLYHYCCSHSRDAIGARGLLVPRPNALDPRIRVVWLTDLAAPWAEQLGLTSFSLRCDRMEFRYRAVDVRAVAPWREFADSFHDRLAEARCALEQFTAEPAHWFVSTAPVPVELDTAYVCAPRNRALLTKAPR